MTFQFTRASSSAPSIDIPAIGLKLRVLLPGSATDNTLEIIETENAAGFGPPLHRHAQTEIFRVLTGCYLFEVNGERMVAAAGDLICVPGGSAHAFVNIGQKPASMQVTILPGFQSAEFFTGLGAVMQHGVPDRATLGLFGSRWGVEFLGPPLHADAQGVADILVEP